MACEPGWQAELLSKYLKAQSKLSQTPPAYVPALYHTEYRTWAKLPEIGYDADVAKLYDLAAFQKALKASTCLTNPSGGVSTVPPVTGLGGAPYTVSSWCQREARLNTACFEKLSKRVQEKCTGVPAAAAQSCSTDQWKQAFLKEQCVKDLCIMPPALVTLQTQVAPDASGTTKWKPEEGSGGYGGKILDEYRVSVSGADDAGRGRRLLALGAFALGAYLLMRQRPARRRR